MPDQDSSSAGIEKSYPVFIITSMVEKPFCLENRSRHKKSRACLKSWVHFNYLGTTVTSDWTNGIASFSFWQIVWKLYLKKCDNMGTFIFHQCLFFVFRGSLSCRSNLTLSGVKYVWNSKKCFCVLGDYPAVVQKDGIQTCQLEMNNPIGKKCF